MLGGHSRLATATAQPVDTEWFFEICGTVLVGFGWQGHSVSLHTVLVPSYRSWHQPIGASTILHPHACWDVALTLSSIRIS